jgi:hypothetical protein
MVKWIVKVGAEEPWIEIVADRYGVKIVMRRVSRV